MHVVRIEDTNPVINLLMYNNSVIIIQLIIVIIKPIISNIIIIYLLPNFYYNFPLIKDPMKFPTKNKVLHI